MKLAFIFTDQKIVPKDFHVFCRKNHTRGIYIKKKNNYWWNLQSTKNNFQFIHLTLIVLTILQNVLYITSYFIDLLYIMTTL